MSALAQLAESLGLSSAPTPSSMALVRPAANDPLTPQQISWLVAVASLLEVGTSQLLERGFIDRHDLDEQTHADPRQVAALIRTNPRWHQC